MSLKYKSNNIFLYIRKFTSKKHELGDGQTEHDLIAKEKGDGPFDVIVRLLFFTNSLMSRIYAKFSGERTLPLFAPFNAFPRP